MNVISIQSQVAWGHVGNSAAVFPMQMHGIDVIAVPTTLLSNRPGYPTIRGRVLDAQLIADLLLGIEERGAVDTAQMILSGYLGSADNAVVVADFVARAKARNPALAYCCDPVHLHRKHGGAVADMAESDLRLNRNHVHVRGLGITDCRGREPREVNTLVISLRSFSRLHSTGRHHV